MVNGTAVPAKRSYSPSTAVFSHDVVGGTAVTNGEWWMVSGTAVPAKRSCSSSTAVSPCGIVVRNGRNEWWMVNGEGNGRPRQAQLFIQHGRFSVWWLVGERP